MELKPFITAILLKSVDAITCKSCIKIFMVIKLSSKGKN